MSGQYFNLPKSIPWRQIAVSPDMMDEKFCNKRFPFPWRSSMAISVYEPKPEELPEELCGDQITYIKVTTSITGYQPTKEEIGLLDHIVGPTGVQFPDFPEEGFRGFIDRIAQDYFACYGVMLNVAVFPSSNKALLERNRIDFSKLREQGAPIDAPLLKVGTKLEDPYEESGVSFNSGQPSNDLVNLITLDNNTDAELDLKKEMVIEIPDTSGIAAVEAKIIYLESTVVKMEAFSADGLVGTKSSELEPSQVHKLIIEAEGIQKVIITTSGGKSSLLEFAYFVLGKEEATDLENFPHIIDFEPKRRDLYQAATEAGEVLTGSRSALSTNKALTHTESTENSVSFEAGVKAVIPIPEFPIGVNASVSTKQTHKETDQDQWSVQTDASRERRETQGTTTQLSQMYNLLTGYHAGTNRAVFLSLARPHVLQPTDYRTFVQGLRAIEGMQEYFLIVSRPKGVKGLCIEASLETGHYPENAVIVEPPEEYYETHFDFPVPTMRVPGGSGSDALGNGAGDGKCEDLSFIRPLPEDFIVDQRQERKIKEGEDIDSGWQEGHPGVALISGHSENVTALNYSVIAGTLVVSAKLCSGRGSSSVGGGAAGDLAIFQGAIFRVFMRSELPKTSHAESHADIGSLFITSRKLCTCFKSGKCIEIIPPPLTPPPEREEDPDIIEFIVDEPKIRINKALMTKSAIRQNRAPLAKEFLSKVQSALTRSHNSISRHSSDDKVGFLESDYFKNQIKDILPKEYLETPISKIKGLPERVIKTLGASLTVDQALSIDLARFSRKTGLGVEEASNARRLLLGISIPDDKSGRPNSKEQ
ncbi:hypothetical protein [Psychrobacter sp. ASPA161_9]|uniref:hypothetical protein n=1 Tax=Psychrobacter sp. ASPA161_9 TaxID=3160961 RepID=UPI003F7D02DB